MSDIKTFKSEPLFEKPEFDLDGQFDSLVRSYLQHFGEVLREIDRAVSEGRTLDCANRAHRLRGSLGQFGFLRAMKLAQALEAAALDESAHCHEILRLLKDSLNEVITTHPSPLPLLSADEQESILRDL